MRDGELEHLDLEELKRRREQAREAALAFGDRYRGMALGQKLQAEWDRLDREFTMLDDAVADRGRRHDRLRAIASNEHHREGGTPEPQLLGQTWELPRRPPLGDNAADSRALVKVREEGSSGANGQQAGKRATLTGDASKQPPPAEQQRRGQRSKRSTPRVRSLPNHMRTGRYQATVDDREIPA